ncbi:MAG: tail fiber domain-containing protein, partial [Lentisphaeria bacterium]
GDQGMLFRISGREPRMEIEAQRNGLIWRMGANMAGADDHGMRLHIGNSDSGNALTINQPGRVGIGTDLPMGGKLHIVGSDGPLLRLEGSEPAAIKLSATRGGYARDFLISMQAGSTSAGDPASRLQVVDSTAGLMRMILDAQGFLGIGEPTPAARLHINEAPNGSGELGGKLLRITGYEPSMQIEATRNATTWNIGANFSGSDDNGMRLNIGNNHIGTAVTVNQAGRVGIGTDLPSAQLEVVGQVKITGGAPGAGKVLTSDASGLASWEDAAGGGGGGAWTESGSNIQRTTGNVGVGAVDNGIRLNVRQAASDIVFNAESSAGDTLFRIHPDGNTQIYQDTLISGKMGVRHLANGIGLNVRGDGTDTFVLNVEDSGGTGLLQVLPDGIVRIPGAAEVNGVLTVGGVTTIGGNTTVVGNTTLSGDTRLSDTGVNTNPIAVAGLYVKETGNHSLGALLVEEMGGTGQALLKCGTGYGTQIRGQLEVLNDNSDIYGSGMIKAAWDVISGHDVYVPNLTNTHDLTVRGVPSANQANFTVISDRSVKKNVTTINGALDKMMQLSGVEYEYKRPEDYGNFTSAQMGFVAQDVESVFPEWVGETEDGKKCLTIRGFEALTVESIREQQALIADLRAEVERLKAQVTAQP